MINNNTKHLFNFTVHNIIVILLYLLYLFYYIYVLLFFLNNTILK